LLIFSGGSRASPLRNGQTRQRGAEKYVLGTTAYWVTWCDFKEKICLERYDESEVRALTSQQVREFAVEVGRGSHRFLALAEGSHHQFSG